ncbi:uncharacterized protein LOC110855464 isoform X2 [Folsomia candida]|uniref:uncharacterized protein LOC110855464 isoform X2 n=1 Tax=Folsomia candida TaxID=158441 RepID=UPI001604CD1A|nr:uncharacterized protein LOC110855464 isoform X2 [Folsomia candida]
MSKQKPIRHQTVGALQIDLVLENIFKYLKIKDVAVCRMINRHWGSVATPLFKGMISKVAVYFSLSRGQSDIDKYCDYVSTIGPDCVKYSNFTFYEPKNASLFLAKCGQHVATLTFQWVLSDSLELLMEILTSDEAPNLKTIEIADLSLDQRSETFLNNYAVTKVATQIKTISIKKCHTTTEIGQELFSRLFRMCPNLREAITWSQSEQVLHGLLGADRISGCAKYINLSTFLLDNWDQQSPSVWGLELPAGGLWPEHVQKLGHLFPNLKELSLGYQSGHALREIWTSFPGMESCTLCVGLDKTCNIDTAGFLKLDEILTGFSKKEMKKAKKMCGDIGKPRFGSITNLKRIAKNSSRLLSCSRLV